MKFLKKNIFIIAGIMFSILVGFITGLVSYDIEQQRVKAIIIENLELNHSLSKSTITSDLISLAEEVRLLAENEQIIKSIRTAYSGLAKEEFDVWATKTVRHFGYHDLLLINSTGDIIYSVAKEMDLGTNLINGPFAESGLGDLFNQIQETTKFSVADFSIYEPSNNILAGFVGAPVMYKNKMIGVISIQLPTAFEKLNIGVHIENIEDYILTTNYYFDRQQRFEPKDSLDFDISKGSSVVMQNSLFLYTPFKLGNLDWGILSIVPPIVTKHFIRWPSIWYHIIVALLISHMVVILASYLFDKNKEGSNYMQSERVLVQNLWFQFNQQKHSFGTDFYYRIKNKTKISVGTAQENIDKTGVLIERFTSKLIDNLNDDDNLNENMLLLVQACIEFKISATQLSKIPDLFLESLEDELGREIPKRAKVAWQKVLQYLSIRVISLLKMNAHMNENQK